MKLLGKPDALISISRPLYTRFFTMIPENEVIKHLKHRYAIDAEYFINRQ